MILLVIILGIYLLFCIGWLHFLCTSVYSKFEGDLERDGLSLIELIAVILVVILTTILSPIICLLIWEDFLEYLKLKQGVISIADSITDGVKSVANYKVIKPKVKK